MTTNADSFRPSAIYAGISVARRLCQVDSTEVDAIKYFKQGESLTSGLDFDSACSLSESWATPIFSASDSDEIAFRETLTNIIASLTPKWTRYARFGRDRMLNTMTEDTAHCFTLAGLARNDPQAIAWWDQLSGDLQSQQEEDNFKNGRIAERKSVDLENERVKHSNIPVKWVAIDDFGAGYDIRSSRLDSSKETVKWLPHFIEVKSSLAGSGFFLTRGEWEFARRRIKRWELHLWIGEKDLPFVIDFKRIRSKIPSDSADSEWKTCWIESTKDLILNTYSMEADQ